MADARQAAAPAPHRAAARGAARSRARRSSSSCSPPRACVATQATVSRDLEELGAVKVRIPGRRDGLRDPRATRRSSVAPDDHLRRVLGEWVVEVAHSAQPRRAAHAAGLGPRRRLGARPGRPARRARHRRRRRHAHRASCAENGGRREAGRRRLAEPRRARQRLTDPSDEGDDTMAKRVVLAYTGGLDTSVAVRWMHRGVGRRGGRRRRRRRPGAPATGRPSASGPSPPARSRPMVRRRPRGVRRRDFLAPALKANALYEGKYPLVSALSRPVIVEAPRRRGPRARRRRRRPRLHRQGQRPGALRGVDAGARARPRGARAGARVGHDPRGLDRATPTTHDIPITATKEKLYSIDDNLWGRAIECGEMEDPWAAPPAGRVAR